MFVEKKLVPTGSGNKREIDMELQIPVILI